MSTVTTSPRRLLLLTAIAAVLGFLGGLAAWVLLHLIGLITNLALFGQWGWTAPPFTELVVGPQIVIAALLAAGAAAGMAATFGAPLAAVVLAIELLLFEFSTRVFIPLVVASSIAGGMHIALFGAGPLFPVPKHDYAGLAVLPLFVVLGLGGGLLAVLISRGLFTVEGWYRRLPVGEFWHPLIGAAVFATIGLFVPRALGVGYDAIGDVLANRIAAGTLAILVL